MAYALRYYKDIPQQNGGAFRLEIYKKDSTTAAIEIGAVIQSLSLQIQGQQGDIDTPIIKTSLSMTFVDATDLENGKKNGFWEEFYTPDAVLWKVVLKAKDAQETAFRTIWGGYVTPDSFSETLSYRGSVNIIARDNIGHLQDFPFDAEGDADGMISLYDLLQKAWAKIESPMDLLMNPQQVMNAEGVVAYDTLMNVSAFKELNWYEAVEKALYSYGIVMRYIGDNAVHIGALRFLPNLGYVNATYVPHLEPVFLAGAQRELVPAAKRIEESVSYELETTVSMPQVKVQDFTGNTYTYRCKIDGVEIDGQSFGTIEHDAPVWSINNSQGWEDMGASTLFFNPHAYELGYFVQQRGLGEEVLRYMYIAANNVDSRRVAFSRNITCSDMIIRMKFGEPCSLDSANRFEQQGVFNLKKVIYSVTIEQNGITQYYGKDGSWKADAQELTAEFDATQKNFDFEQFLSMSDLDGNAELSFIIKKIEYAQTSYTGNKSKAGLYACVQDLSFCVPENLSLLENNTVNTNYQEGNNVILTRDPELAPAYNVVALPAFIKNGIFYRQGDAIVPAKTWGWAGGSQLQMAVFNHLQLLSYYAKPNNLISGTIVNADTTRMSVIYEWKGAEHILVSGNINLLTGNIDGAMLREFARYEDMWSEVVGAGLPPTEQESRSNVEGGAGASSNPSTYSSTTNVNIGTGGGGGTGASYLNDLLDVDTAGVTAQSVLYYNGTAWVDMSLASLLSGYAKKGTTLADYGITNAYTKGEVDSKVTELNTAIAKKADASNVYTMAQIDSKVQTINNAIALRYTKTEVDGIVTTINQSISSVDNKYSSTKAWVDTLASLIVNDGGNVRIKANLIVEGDSASGGVGGGTSVGISGITLNGKTYTDDNGDGIIDLGTITSGLTSVNWTDVQGRPTKLSQFTNDLGLGSLAYVNGLTASDVGALSTAGGTVDSGTVSSVPLKLHTNTGSVSLRLSNNSAVKADIGWDANNGIFLYNYPSNKFIGVKDDGTPYYYGTTYHTLYHTGNFNPANYLPLTGGTLSSFLVIDDAYHYPEVSFKKGGAYWGSFGFSGANTPAYSDGSAWYPLLHSGNIGSYKAGDSDKLGGYGSSDYVKSLLDNIDDCLNFRDRAILKTSWISGQGDFGTLIIPTWVGNKTNDYYLSELRFENFQPPKFRCSHNGVVEADWKTIAFTDSNVASADYATSAGALTTNGNIAAQANSNRSVFFQNFITFDTNAAYGIYRGSYMSGKLGATDIYITAQNAIILEGGKVGIGTLTPQYDLHVDGTMYGNLKMLTPRTIWGQSFDGTGNVNGSIEGCTYVRSNSKTGYYIGDRDLVLGSSTGGLALFTYGYTPLSFSVNSNQAMLINSSGNVTIGASDLAGSNYKLYVQGSVSMANDRVCIPINGDRITFNASSGYTMGILAMNSGNTYIAAPLATNSSTGAKTPILIGWCDGTYPFYISPSSNVGIGTTSPAYKLEVNGTARISGAVTMSSTLSVAGATTINGALTAGATTINGNLIVKGDVASA